jgi:hypothetical protein
MTEGLSSICDKVVRLRKSIKSVEFLIRQDDSFVVIPSNCSFLEGSKSYKMRTPRKDSPHLGNGCLFDPVDCSGGAATWVHLSFPTAAAIKECGVVRTLAEVDGFQVPVQLRHYRADTSHQLKQWAGHYKVTPQQALLKGFVLVL